MLTANPEFCLDLARVLAERISECHTDNSRAFYHLRDEAARLEDEAWCAANQGDLASLLRDKGPELIAELENKSYLYTVLADDASRVLLVELAAYAILGHRRVRLSYHGLDNVAQREAFVRQTDQAQQADPVLLERVRREWASDYFSLFDLAPLGRPLRLYTHAEELFRFVTNPTYCRQTPDGPIYPGPGDIVLDCGACFGDVSLEFAMAVGETGRVYAFEPYPEVWPVLRLNLEINPQLAARVETVALAVSNTDDEQVRFLGWGGGSRLDRDGSRQGTFQVQTLSIDSFVARYGLQRVDFIKMDIEGAECDALAGAEQTLRRFRPKLGICVYHRDRTDFLHVVRQLDALQLGYRFFLNHHAVNFWDTVLYAMP